MIKGMEGFIIAKQKEAKKTIQILAIIFVIVLIGLVGVFFWIYSSSTNSTANKGYTVDNTVYTTKISQTVYDTKGELTTSTATSAMNTLSKLINYSADASDIQKLNANAGLDWTTLDSKTISVLNTALTVATDSNGAYDPTAEPVYDLWAFGTSTPTVPTSEQMNLFLPLVGYKNLRVDTSTNKASLKNTYMLTNIDDLVDGALCDSAVASYGSSTATGGIVSAGTAVGVYGTKPGSSNWNLLVKNSDAGDTTNPSIATFSVKSGFAATHLMNEHAFTQNSITYNSILNTTTGMPVDNNLLSVTVTGQSGATCDALAMACLSLGKDQSMALLTKYNTNAIFVTTDHVVTATGDLAKNITITDTDYKLST